MTIIKRLIIWLSGYLVLVCLAGLILFSYPVNQAIQSQENQCAETMVASRLASSQALGQALEAPDGFIDSLVLHFATYTQTPNGVLELSLLRGRRPPTELKEISSRTLFTNVFDAALVPDNTAWVWDLPQAVSGGREGLYLLVRRLPGKELTPLTMWLCPGNKLDPVDKLIFSPDGKVDASPGRGGLQMKWAYTGTKQAYLYLELMRRWPWIDWIVAAVGLIGFFVLIRLWPRPEIFWAKMSGGIRLSNWLVNLGVVLVAAGVLFLVGEIVVRLLEATGREQQVSVETLGAGTDAKEFHVRGNDYYTSLYRLTDAGWRLNPNVKVTIKNSISSGRDLTIRTNSLGHRHEELGPKKKGEFRILVLGDSITVTDYLPDEETYVRRLEEMLQAKAPAGAKITVINAGVGGIDLRSEYHLLLETGLATKPDLVLVGLYLNDVHQSTGVLPAPPGRFPFSHSRLLRWLYFRVALLRQAWVHDPARQDIGGLEKFLKGRHPAKGDYMVDRNAFDQMIKTSWYDWGNSFGEDSWRRMAAIMDRIKILGWDKEFKTAAALFPVGPQVYTKYLYNLPQEYFQKYMTRQNIPHIDLLSDLRRAWANRPELAKRYGFDGYLYVDQCHLSSMASEVVARTMARALINQQLVPTAE